MSAHTGSPAAHRRGAAARAQEEALVARLADLGTALDGEPDPAFRDATRARLVAMAAVRSPEPAARRTLRRFAGATAVETAAARWRGRLTAGLAGAAVAVTALAGLVGVSSGAQPGDPLYGLKRGTEQTQLALAGDSTRGQTLLDFASIRLAELEQLLAEGTTALPAVPAEPGAGGGTVLAADASPDLVVEVLRTMDAQTAEGTAWLITRSVELRDAAPLTDLLDWAAEQSADLTALAPEVPDGAEEAMDSSLALLTQVSARGTALQEALACAAGPAVAGTDALGPQPADCVEETPPPASGGTTGSVPPGTATPSGEPTDQPVPGVPTPTGGTAGSPSTGAGSGSGSGAGGGTGGGPGSGTTSRPSTPSRPTPGLPLPSLPLPGTGGTSTAPGGGAAPSTSTSSPPAIIDTPLPVCLPPIIC
ncbi:DUF5667 domain-containing protein [Geodermatophilus sp. SYSU D00691]